jgi:hypothetical protein
VNAVPLVRDVIESECESRGIRRPGTSAGN